MDGVEDPDEIGAFGEGVDEGENEDENQDDGDSSDSEGRDVWAIF